MQTLNYWKQFENTGKIADYLTYRGCGEHTGEKDTADIGGKVTPDGATRMPYPGETGVYSGNAGIY